MNVHTFLYFKQKNNDTIVNKFCLIDKFNQLIILTYYQITLVTTGVKDIEMRTLLGCYVYK